MIFRNVSKQTILAKRGLIARSFFARAKGLMFRRTFNPGEGLFITPCDAIHMMGVFFPIDVAFVDRDFRVVAINAEVPPTFGLATGGSDAWSTFELPAGTLASTNTQVGDILIIEPETASKAPPP